MSRHIEHSDMTGETLNDRVFYKAEWIEDIVSESIEYEQLHRAVSELYEVQRHRLKLYFFGELTYEQIAKLEGCKYQAVLIDKAFKIKYMDCDNKNKDNKE